MAKSTGKSTSKSAPKKAAPTKSLNKASSAKKPAAQPKKVQKPIAAKAPPAAAKAPLAADKNEKKSAPVVSGASAGASKSAKGDKSVAQPSSAKSPPFATTPAEPRINSSAIAKAANDGDEDAPSSRTIKPPMRSEDLFTSAELASFRGLLVAERKKILEKAKQAMESGNIHLDKDEMYDEVDLATATVEQNLTFRLLDRDRKLLGEVDHAIAKLDNGDYGFCEGTGEAIPKRRLELRPWCRHSVKYKEQLERMEKSGRGVADEDEL